MSCCANPGICCDKHIKHAKAAFSIALVGNPNCGKTTLFNALTGAWQKVGNWPGVTVERKCGYFTENNQTIEVVDLPGVYSINMPMESALDECIACQFILQHQADVMINIVDAAHLERHLYLTVQLLELGVPMILALNMMDTARAKGLQIDIEALSRELGCPVVALEAQKGIGIKKLKEVIPRHCEERSLRRSNPDIVSYPDVILKALTNLPNPNAIFLLEGDIFAQKQATPELLEEVAKQQAIICAETNEDADILIADARYRFIQQLMNKYVKISANSSPKKRDATALIDNIVLNRALGIPIFLAIMYCLFFFSISVGGFFQEYFDDATQTIFVDQVSVLLSHIHAPNWLIVLLANGVGKGINTVLTFIPVIGAMFLFLALLEDSGYMARAAFVIDRLMRMLGLPGKAFVPMIVGFGCNVPAVMAARTLENKSDRIITILMTPFMSCSARLAIYAVFIAAFFPSGGQNVVFALYLIGIAMAVLTGFILRKTLLKGDPSPLLMELPSYHLPQMKSLFLHAWQRLKGFVFRAGKLILPISVLIGVLNTLNIDGSMNAGDGSVQSILSMIGQWITPIFAPMGIQADNWPATVGLLTGVLAKEVVVGTLNTLYAQMDANVYGVMYQQFAGSVGAFAYLLFVLLYFPCVSTMAAMVRELHKGWAVFSMGWSTGIAYMAAVIFYQVATFMQHPVTSAEWIVGLMIVFFATIGGVRFYAAQASSSHHSSSFPRKRGSADSRFRGNDEIIRGNEGLIKVNAE